MLASALGVLFKDRNLARLLGGLWVTLRLSAVSILLSVALGLALGMVMTLRSPIIRALTRLWLETIRIVPQLGNLLLGPTYALKRPSKEVEAEAMAALARVGLADRAHALPRQLSGGQKQRVALVRAMLMHPEVLLLDEITAALDPEMVREVLDVVLELARSGMTMVIVTHEMRFAEAVADRVVFLENGLVVEESVPAQFFHQPHTQRAQQFLASFCYDSVRDGKNMQNTKEAN